MWTHQMLVQGVFLSNSSPRERELSRLTLVYLTKQNKKYPLFTENCVESYPLSRHTNITLSDHHFPSISIVIINQFFTNGDAKDNYRIAFPISGDHYEVPELEDHLDTRFELSLSRYSQQECHGWRISDAPTATQTFSAWHWVLWRTRYPGHIPNSTWRQPKWYLQWVLPNKV